MIAIEFFKIKLYLIYNIYDKCNDKCSVSYTRIKTLYFSHCIFINHNNIKI